MADEKPLSELVVGDRFWLAYAQDVVRGAVAAPERRAEQLAAAIAWFWTLYSAAALVVVTAGAARLPGSASWLIALPSAVLIVAYWMAARVRRPMLIEFDPRVPDEIEQAHNAAARDKRRALWAAEFATLVAAASVVLAIGVALVGAAPPRAELTVRVDPANPQHLLVLGSVSKNAVVHLSVRPNSTASAASAATYPPTATANAPVSVTLLQRADAQGVLRASLGPVAAVPQRVTATWTEDAMERSASVEVKPGD